MFRNHNEKRKGRLLNEAQAAIGQQKEAGIPVKIEEGAEIIYKKKKVR